MQRWSNDFVVLTYIIPYQRLSDNSAAGLGSSVQSENIYHLSTGAVYVCILDRIKSVTEERETQSALEKLGRLLIHSQGLL